MLVYHVFPFNGLQSLQNHVKLIIFCSDFVSNSMWKVVFTIGIINIIFVVTWYKVTDWLPIEAKHKHMWMSGFP